MLYWTSAVAWEPPPPADLTDTYVSMPLLKALTHHLDAYLARHPDEQGDLQPLLSGLGESDDLWNRKNMSGHLTATALVLADQDRKVFMIRHKALNRWLAPGGHVDPGEMPSEAASRELEEETGLIGTSILKEPIDIDIHTIPPRPSKNEGEHFHFDFRYVMRSDSLSIPKLESSEIIQSEWQDLEALKHAYARVYRKLMAA